MVLVFNSQIYQWFTNISGESDLQKTSQNEEIKNMSELKKNIYDEKNGLHYTLIEDYYIVDLKLRRNTALSESTDGCTGNI